MGRKKEQGGVIGLFLLWESDEFGIYGEGMIGKSTV